MPNPISEVFSPLGSAQLPGVNGASWLIDRERALWLGDNGAGQAESWCLSTQAPMMRLSFGASLDQDSAVTLNRAGAQIVVMAGDALHILCARTLEPQAVLRGHAAKINRILLLDDQRLLSFGRDAELIVWDLRRGVLLSRHDRRGLREVSVTGGPDSRLVSPFGVLRGRAWVLGLQDLSHDPRTLVSHRVGLTHRARALQLTAVARPHHAEVVGGLVWRSTKALCVSLCLFTPAGRRVLWEGFANNPDDRSLFLWVEAISRDVLRVVLTGVASMPRRFTVSLTSGQVTPWPGDGLTSGGRHLTFDGSLWDLHRGVMTPLPETSPQRGERRQGEDLSEDGHLALTRAGDSLTWWSLTR